MKNLKKFILIIILGILIGCVSTNVLATDFLVNVTANGVNTNTNTGNSDIGTITPIDSTPTFTTVNQVVYATQNVNIKQNASSSATVLSSLTKDQSVTRIGVSESSGWSKVTLANGTVGYAESIYLTEKAPTSVGNTNTTNATNTSLYNNTNNTSTNTNTLPQAGVGDNTGMMIVIGVCIISAIYAYKKIRDYNV